MFHDNNLELKEILKILLSIIYLRDTINAIIVKHPPVVDVSYCYVCIFRKKSNDFNIFNSINTIYICM